MEKKATYTVLVDGLCVVEEYVGESYEEALEVFNHLKEDKTYGVTYLYKNNEELAHN